MPTLLVDLTTGESVEYADARHAVLACEGLNRDGQRLRHDRIHQGPPRRMTYPVGCDALELVNLRRQEHGLAPLASLRRVHRL